MWFRIVLLTGLLSLLHCSSGGGGVNPPLPDSSELTKKGFAVGNCLIDNGLLLDGGPPPDGIPAVLQPQFTALSTIESELPLNPEDLMLVVDFGTEQRAYPEMMLWNHEVVNDTVDGRSIVISYCPLTGSTVVFDRGDSEDFRVSGLLYQSNLVMYDSTSNSLWPQMNLGAECGDRVGEDFSIHPVREMNLEMLRKLHPDIQTLYNDRRTDITYGFYPYGSYDQLDNNTLLFSVDNLDTTLPIKSLVLMVFDGSEIKGYPHQSFGGDALVNDQVGDQAYVVFHIESGRYANAFRRDVAGHILNFELVVDETDDAGYVLRDQDSGTRWRLSGEPIDGPLAEHVLTQALNMNAMWFSFRASFPTATIFEPATAKGLELFE